MNLTFQQALSDEVTTLQAQFPDLAERLGRAHNLLREQRLFPEEDGHSATVASKDGSTTYLVNGTCQCPASQHRQEACYHRLAFRVYQKVCDRLMADEECWTIAPEPTANTAGMDPRFLVTLDGKDFVTYQGLLAMAHQRGLIELKAEWTYNDAELSLAHAVARFANGQRFEESGDSSKENVGEKVILHWRRISLVRAKARCLRDALALNLVAVEELGDV